ncbi:MAG: hypothetical protein Fur0021_29740 [Candidatus Promineifilaceae bacterium]
MKLGNRKKNHNKGKKTQKRPLRAHPNRLFSYEYYTLFLYVWGTLGKRKLWDKMTSALSKKYLKTARWWDRISANGQKTGLLILCG